MDVGFVLQTTGFVGRLSSKNAAVVGSSRTSGRRMVLRASVQGTFQEIKRRAEHDIELISKSTAALAIAAALALGGSHSAIADVPDSIPNTFFLDDAGVVQKANGGYVEKALKKLEENTGFKVHFVITRYLPSLQDPTEYAEEVFQQWKCGANDVVIVAGSKIAKAGVYAGSDAGKLLSTEIAASIGSETFPFKAREEAFSLAANDVSNRVVAVLSGKEDPGAPKVVRESGDGTFKTKDETEKGKKKYTTVVVALLVASFVIPMVQYYWYVKDD
eukprot:CAMPEP_0184753178 /NCGR_PEP_ID=MMETSP0315-20130426/43967_1 /TAXON_ID=101924 /ORGANISM="Rhodosorus marinus, Strain UTEX LB 2760" /LENGTH=273 /DNA_ID=CAMNT_0027232547 /DNA_START=562 /DNA_END=1383 /DNA_ORIENTATION=+